MNNIEIGILKTKFDIFKINRVLLLCFRAYTVRQFKHECHVTAYFAALFYNINLRKTREFAGRIFKNTYMEAENSQKLSNSPKLSLSLSLEAFSRLQSDVDSLKGRELLTWAQTLHSTIVLAELERLIGYSAVTYWYFSSVAFSGERL